MKFGHFRRSPKQDNIAALYGTIVAQARSPVFYRNYGVSDTVTGRLELVLLHTYLFCRRVAAEEGATRGLGQSIFDLFCRDMDGNLREIGVGDLSVPRHMRRIGEAFYGRAAVYTPALAASDERGLSQVLMRNVFSGQAEKAEGARRLTDYTIAADRHLARLADADLVQGHVSFPDPESV
ncbi:MAG: ubiquinol-cytochrome C chaperone family protein [Xanthobacteraceae bacterium]